MSRSTLIPSRSLFVLFALLAAGFVVAGATATDAHATKAYGQLPLHFEANQGQTHEAVRFFSRGASYSLYLTAGEAVLVLAKPPSRGNPNPDGKRDAGGMQGRSETPTQARAIALRMRLVGAAPAPVMSGLEELPGKANFLIGRNPQKWRANVPTYAKVHYREVYPGIDLVYYGNQRQLEHDFVVAPGANPKRILLDFQGMEKLEIDAKGDLVLHTAAGDVRERKPVIYQDIDGVRREIAGSYVLEDANRVGFKLAAYDHRRPLVIDPVVLFYSTYLGGTSVENGQATAVDGHRNVYVTGYAASLDFPTTRGAFQSAFAGGLIAFDAFVAKLNPTGSALVYSTYLGGSSDDWGFGIVVDTDGNAFVAGSTGSFNFPTTAGAFQPAIGGRQDGFVAKLNPTGSGLLYSTYLGGSDHDGVSGIAIDGNNNVYVTGGTISFDFPTTPGGFQPDFSGGGDGFAYDAFVAKLNPAGSGLVYSTYLGGASSGDWGYGIAVDALGNAYVTGLTSSIDFPTTQGAFQPALARSIFDPGPLTFDAFVTKLNSTGSGAVYSTYLGGSRYDAAFGITVDALGNAFVTGVTEGFASINFPTTPGAFQSAFAGGLYDAFVTKFNPVGSALVYSTYLGGSDIDDGFAIAVDGQGNAYVSGQTWSINFPTTPGAFQPTSGGRADAFVTKLNATGSASIYSSYLGGNDYDLGLGIALDALGNAYVTGITYSLNFPTRPGAFQPTLAGGVYDAFVAKIVDVALPPPLAVGKISGDGSLKVANGIATFAFSVQHNTANARIQGKFSYVNQVSREKVRSVQFTSFTITGNTATFGGLCTRNGIPCTFTVAVMDSGKSGDKFAIALTAGLKEEGTLRSGDIEIRIYGSEACSQREAADDPNDLQNRNACHRE